MDDSTEQIVDKQLNIFFYKDGEYTRAYSSVAPTVFENAIDTFTESDVEFWKGRAETRFNDYTPGNSTINVSTNGTVSNVPLAVQGGAAEEAIKESEDIPF